MLLEFLSIVAVFGFWMLAAIYYHFKQKREQTERLKKLWHEEQWQLKLDKQSNQRWKAEFEASRVELRRVDDRGNEFVVILNLKTQSDIHKKLLVGDISKGMTQDMVEYAWGTPTTIKQKVDQGVIIKLV